MPDGTSHRPTVIRVKFLFEQTCVMSSIQDKLWTLRKSALSLLNSQIIEFAASSVYLTIHLSKKVYQVYKISNTDKKLLKFIDLDSDYLKI